MGQLRTASKKMVLFTLVVASVSIGHARNERFFAPLPILGEAFFGRQEVVLNGRLVQEESQFWRFTARLAISDDSGEKRARCTGALVQPRVILTSAHCFPQHMKKVIAQFDPQGDYQKAIAIRGQGFRINPDYIFTKGTRKTTSDGGLVTNWERVAQLREQYNSDDAPALIVNEAPQQRLETIGSDLAVIVLEEAVPYPFEPISFASQAEVLTEDDTLYVIGYGRNGDGARDMDKQLRYALYRPVVVMKDRYNRARLIQSFPREEAASGPGDSGGPVVMEVDGRFLLVGIHAASTTREFALCAVPQTHYNWIIDTVLALIGANIRI